MPSGSRPSKPKPSEVASEAKKNFIPYIRSMGSFKMYSYLYYDPLTQLDFSLHPRSPMVTPTFHVITGDPVDQTTDWARQMGSSIPFICAANDKRAGGDFETGVLGYEERLCRRSTLSATLATVGPGVAFPNYPIPSKGAILSEEVVVFRGIHDRYEVWPETEYKVLPVVSLPSIRWPKLHPSGKQYSFLEERNMVRDKLIAAVRVCVYAKHTHIVIGDFGLGNSYRNPPQEIAELWREVLLWDPEIRGRLQAVAFVFEDPGQSTHRLILEDLTKKAKTSSSGSSRSRSSRASSSSSSTPSSSSGGHPTDFEIFSAVFHETEIARVVAERDPRYDMGNLMI